MFLGHSNASSAAVQTALSEGAHGFAHLYNAMSPMTSRAAGMLGAAINSNAYASIICDGIHVDLDMVGLALRARPVVDRMIIVSDAMPTVNGPDEFTLYDQVIMQVDGRLINAEGDLAGAHITMAQSAQNLMTRLDMALVDVLKMSISNPARVMGLGHLYRLCGLHLDQCMIYTQDAEFVRFKR